MSRLTDLIEKRKQAYDAMHDLREKLVTEKRDDFTAEEQTAWEASNADYDRLDAAIDKEQRMSDVTARMDERMTQQTPGRENTAGNAPAPSGQVTEESRMLALQGWAAMQMRGVATQPQMDAMQAVGLSPWQKELRFSLPSKAPKTEAECRALTTGTGSSGGYTIPEGFVYELEKALLYFGGVRQVATIMRTASGNALPWPTMNDTSNDGAMIAESTQDATNEDPSFGVVTFNAYKGTSKIVLVPYELLEDSAFPLATFLPAALGERLGRLQNTQCTTGTGSSAPNGIVTAATAGKTTASATAITFDEVMDLVHSVDIAYRDMPGAGFMFHDTILKYLRQLKDSDLAYIWQPANAVTGAPNAILGYPYKVSSAMASAITAGQKTMLFGALSKFVIREVNDIRVYRMQERYRDYDQDGFVALMRFDSDLLDAGTHPVKYLLQLTGS
jgi:HK97 family phage major capsid protein